MVSLLYFTYYLSIKIEYNVSIKDIVYLREYINNIDHESFKKLKSDYKRELKNLADSIFSKLSAN